MTCHFVVSMNGHNIKVCFIISHYIIGRSRKKNVALEINASGNL